MKTKECKSCGKLMENVYNNRKYHEECYSIIRRDKRTKPEKKIRKRLYDQEYNKVHHEEILKKRREYTNRPEIRIRTRDYMRKYATEYRKKNKEKCLEQYRKDAKKYREKIKNDWERLLKSKEWKKQWEKEKFKEDIQFKIRHLLRHRVREALKVYTLMGKIMSSEKYGIDYGAIIEHLKPFPEDLSKYHIDHIKPLCSFSLINEDGSTNLEEVKKAFAPENHQWLLAQENFRKGGRL